MEGFVISFTIIPAPRGNVRGLNFMKEGSLRDRTRSLHQERQNVAGNEDLCQPFQLDY
jgi:hypothetical protein